MTTVDQITTGYGLLEGPVYDTERDTFYFADALHGGTFRVGEGDKIIEEIPGRRGIGGMAVHATGGFVVGGRTVALKRGAHTHRTYCELPAGMSRFNDLIADDAGRVYVGSTFYESGTDDMAGFRPGYLHLIDLDGSVRIVLDDVRVANGLGFSPDGTTLYFVHTGSRRLMAYRIASPGELVEPRVLFQWDVGLPDGLAVARDGSILVGVGQSGCVSVIGADGAERERITVPHPRVTNVCFAGPSLDTLYITTATDDAAGRPATLYRTTAPVPGLPVPVARIAT